MKLRLRITWPTGETREFEHAGPVICAGRDPGCELCLDGPHGQVVSSRHARIDLLPDKATLSDTRSTNGTLLNDCKIEGPVALRVGDQVRLGNAGPVLLVLGLESMGLPPPLPPPVPGAPGGATVMADGVPVSADVADLGILRLGEGGIIGRDAGSVRFLLPHPHVSRRHARLKVEPDGVFLTDLDSANGTFVNGRRLTRRVRLRPNDQIDIGPYSLTFTGSALVSATRTDNIELAAHRLSRVVRDRATGKPLTLLDEISLVVRPREFVCLLGPSGSGKSTLLTALSGRAAPDDGQVSINGQDLFANFEALKKDMVVVPQADALHGALAVGDALDFTARLRLPPDTSAAEVGKCVDRLLDTVGLSARRQTLIRHLSGGQKKRASLANELLGEPSLLFLDEVTSGLDEQTDQEMMELFRQVADKGKTVVCVTHSLANVEANCHLVVVLTEGGRLAFVGSPAEARDYFGVARLGELYRRLGGRAPEEWREAFRASPYYARYVRARLKDVREADTVERGGLERAARRPFRQAAILIRRYLAIWRGDALALGALLGQSVLVALLLGAVFGDLSKVENPLEHAQRSLNLLLLLAVSCFWFGCNNAAKELVKERVIYSRERDFNLRIDSYYASKFLVLSAFGMAQATLLLLIVRGWCGPPGGAVGQWVVLALLAVAGTALGLLISAASRTEEMALALVPIAVIPQIILAGVIAPLSGFSKALAQGFISTHWGKRALDALLPEEVAQVLGIERPSYIGPLLILLLHAGAFVAATLLLLWIQSRRRSGV